MFRKSRRNGQIRLSNGYFSLIIRKVSLAGSAHTLVAFTLFSKDINIKEVRIIRNCYSRPHEANDPDGDYICIITIFDELDASKTDKEISIDYEYYAQNILKTNNENSNFAIWKYDNHFQENAINNATVNIFSQEKIDQSSIVVANKKAFHMAYTNDTSVLSWTVSSIQKDSVFEFSFKSKMFNNNCQPFRYNKHASNTALNVIFSCLFGVFAVFMLIYVFIQEYNKHQHLTVSMEMSNIKKLAESNNLNERILQANVSYDQYNVTG